MQSASQDPKAVDRIIHMKATQWEQARDIFEAALDLSEEERDGFVRESCNADCVLLAEVQALLEADVEAEGRNFLNPGWVASTLERDPDLALYPGDQISGRFRIVRLLGEGGMGRVYEAHDIALGVPVALKTLRSEVARNSEMIKRFHQEVRIAHRITHSNVCRTFHLDRERRPFGDDGSGFADLTFITMEYLNGETLQQILKHDGALPLDRALDIARQMADALSAAHRSGIVHRDIKPGNIMICAPDDLCGEKRRVVITDFGLAKITATTTSDFSAISHAGAALGTLAYMAPEQLTGGEVSAATDIYSFGLVLFEMVTGHRAFPDSVTWAAAMKRTCEVPPFLSGKLPQAQGVWRETIEVCLQIDPSKRYQSVAEVMGSLDGEIPKTRRPRARNLGVRLRPKWVALASFLVSVSLLAGAYRLYISGTESVAPVALVYLAPVKNETGEKQLDRVTELVRAGLEQSAQIDLLSDGRVADVLQQMNRPADTVIDAPIAREIAMRTGASRVVLVTLGGNREDYRMDVEIQQPDNTPKRYRAHWQMGYRWHDTGEAKNARSMPPELLSNIRLASNWVRKKTGESSGDIARLDVPPEDVTTSNWAALQDFSDAQHMLAQNNPDGAIRMLQSATVKDSHFALAYSELANNLYSVFRTEEALAAYNKAIALEQEGRLSLRERYFIIAEHAADTNDYEVAATAYKGYTDIYPNDYLGWFYLAYPLTQTGRPEQALVALKRSLSIRPDRGGTIAMMALTYLATGNIDEARRMTSRLEMIGAKDDALYTKGVEDFLDDRYDDAANDFRDLRNASTQIYRAASYASLGRVLAEQGKWSEALDALDQGAEQSRETSDRGNLTARLIDKAYILCKLQRYRESFAALNLATDERLDPIHILIESSTLRLAIQSRSFLVRTEAIRRLRTLLNKVRAMPHDVLMDTARHRLEGELEWSIHHQKRALEEFRAADKLDSPVSDRSYIGQILLASATLSTTHEDSLLLRREGMAKLEPTLTHPANVWREAWMYPPGVLADEIEVFLDGCRDSEWQSDLCARASTKYQKLRPENPGKN